MPIVESLALAIVVRTTVIFAVVILFFVISFAVRAILFAVDDYCFLIRVFFSAV